MRARAARGLWARGRAACADERGETLVESLVSFLVIALILVGFFALFTTGSNLNRAATSSDAAANEPMEKTGSTVTVTIDGTEYNDVALYGNGTLYAYRDDNAGN
jgi:Tfp pilus assembly protein PilV